MGKESPAFRPGWGRLYGQTDEQITILDEATER